MSWTPQQLKAAGFSDDQRIERNAGGEAPAPPEREAQEMPVEVQSMSFEVPGRPHGKKRPKLATKGGKPHSYEHPETALYEKKVARCARMARPEGWPLGAAYRISLQAYYPDRKFADLDNILKAIWDGCESVLYDNDRDVEEIGKCKRVVERGSEGVTLVRVEILEER